MNYYLQVLELCKAALLDDAARVDTKKSSRDLPRKHTKFLAITSMFDMSTSLPSFNSAVGSLEALLNVKDRG